MGYLTPIGGVTRALNPTTTIHSTSFGLLSDYLQFGNRMAVIQIPSTSKFVIWSSIPVGETFDQVIGSIAREKKIELSEFEIVAGIIPNRQHNLAAVGLKKRYPNLTLIGPYGIQSSSGLKLDYEIGKSQADTIIKGGEIHKDLKNFEFILLDGHKNKEVVTFDKTTQTIYESDLFFNVPSDGINTDQYPNVSQNKGLGGWLTWGMNNESYFGRFIMTQRLFKLSDKSKKGFQAMYNNWNFESIVLSHGNVVETNAKPELLKVFKEYLS